VLDTPKWSVRHTHGYTREVDEGDVAVLVDVARVADALRLRRARVKYVFNTPGHVLDTHTGCKIHPLEC